MVGIKLWTDEIQTSTGILYDENKIMVDTYGVASMYRVSSLHKYS